jgi:hypothetical protein
MTLYVMKVKQACEGEPYLLKTLGIFSKCL